MTEIKRMKVEDPDELDILLAIWILACNDELPGITYEGIKYRLGLPDAYDVRGLVESRGEMFRKGVPPKRLEKWKQEMLSGKRLPSWIRAIEDESVREATIKGLTPEDLFRSQFRTEADAPRSPVEIIDWGLQHIDRLRKAGIEAREERVKRVANIWIPILSLIIALTAVLSSAYLHYRSNTSQIEIKRYEVSFKPKQDGYGKFMMSILESYENTFRNDQQKLLASLYKVESAFYSLEPFLGEDERIAIWGQYKQFYAMCFELAKQPVESSSKRTKLNDSFLWYKDYFRTQLYRALFG